MYRNGRVLSPQVTEQLIHGAAEDDDDEPADDSDFSDEELRILHMLVNGASNEDIAGELYISVATAKRRLQRIFTKLAVSNRSQAIAETVRRNLLA